MSKANRSKGYVSLDTLFAILPAIILIALTLKTAAWIGDGMNAKVATQERFDRLVSNAEYLVNYGLAKKDGKIYYPNWLTELDENEIQKVGNASGLIRFGAAFDVAPKSFGNTCIYRIIVYGEAKEIRKLYFCGE